MGVIGPETCLFCRIVAGTVPAERLYEDDQVIAIRDIAPQAQVHLLIIPRRHIASPADVGQAEQALMGAVAVVAAVLARREGVAESGFRLVANSGPEGGQVVPHVHVHLLGGRVLGWPPG